MSHGNMKCFSAFFISKHLGDMLWIITGEASLLDNSSTGFSCCCNDFMVNSWTTSLCWNNIVK